MHIVDPFSKWIDCSKEHVMPIEAYLYYQKREANLKEFYEKMQELAPQVDAGKMSAASAFSEGEKVKRDILNTTCAVKFSRADGTEVCMMERIDHPSPGRLK